jgi:hypothetical protein
MEWDKDQRTRAFRNASVATIQNAGHWVHHDRLAESLAVVCEFLKI